MIATARVAFHDFAPGEESFERAVLEGLSSPRKSIPCRFLYDTEGSALFDRICETPEYYPTRTETRLLTEAAPRLAEWMGPGVQLIELGAGSSRKIRTLLGLLDRPAGYVAIDISGEHLRQATTELAQAHPEIPVSAICADYLHDLDLPEALRTGFTKRVAFFPGSTIGNLPPAEAISLLRAVGRLVGPNGDFLIGVDLEKDAATLNAAYNDAAGVTAQFTMNLLARINRELGGDLDLERFRHLAFYAPAQHRIEIYLESTSDQIVRIAGKRFALAAGERILTEYSYKYTTHGFRELARSAGWVPVETLTDAAGLFSIHYLKWAG